MTIALSSILPTPFGFPSPPPRSIFFFLKNPPPTETSPLSQHDALPIWRAREHHHERRRARDRAALAAGARPEHALLPPGRRLQRPSRRDPGRDPAHQAAEAARVECPPDRDRPALRRPAEGQRGHHAGDPRG